MLNTLRARSVLCLIITLHDNNHSALWSTFDLLDAVIASSNLLFSFVSYSYIKCFALCSIITLETLVAQFVRSLVVTLDTQIARYVASLIITFRHLYSALRYAFLIVTLDTFITRSVICLIVMLESPIAHSVLCLVVRLDSLIARSIVRLIVTFSCYVQRSYSTLRCCLFVTLETFLWRAILYVCYVRHW